jgi:dynein heavy chain 1, cytosolic
MLNKLRKMRTLEDDDDEVSAKGDHLTGTAQQPAWMRVLLSNCNEWLSVLPSVSSLVFPMK